MKKWAVATDEPAQSASRPLVERQQQQVGGSREGRGVTQMKGSTRAI